jgi:hypothetical protein
MHVLSIDGRDVYTLVGIQDNKRHPARRVPARGNTSRIQHPAQKNNYHGRGRRQWKTFRWKREVTSPSGLVYVEGKTFKQDGYQWSSFYISKYEVTQELWKSVMKDNPSGFKGDKRPVEHVSLV